MQIKKIVNLIKIFFNISYSKIPIIIIFLFIPSYLNEFISLNTNWDLYNNLYFGSRLLEGELLWSYEFHDKFPIVQYLFSIPAFFKTIIIWKIISFSLHIIASLLLFKTCIKISRFSWNIFNENSIILPRYISSIYFISPSLLQGYSHFSGTSASFFCISFCIIIIFYDKNIIFNPFKSLIFWNSLFLVSLAISIRPYFGLIGIFLGFWIALRFFTIEKKRINFIFILNYFFKWNYCLFSITLIINFLPYLITNNVKLAIDGIILNSQNINPQNIISIINSQKNVLNNSGIKYLIIFLLTIGIYILIDLFKSNRIKLYKNKILLSPDFLFLGIISPLLLQILILSKHFWDHYSLMFMPFFAILSLGLITIFFEKIKNDNLNIFDIKLFFSCYLLIIFGLSSLSSTINFLRNFGSKKIYVDEFSQILASYSHSRFNKLNFLDLTSQKIHLKLNHGRTGQPHPAHISHLENNWYYGNKIFVPTRFKQKFPLSIDDLFFNISQSDLKIIIADDRTKISNLFENSFLFKKNDYLTDHIQNKLQYKAIIYERIENKF